MKDQKEYTGSVYVGVAGSEFEHGEARDSIDGILLRPGDEGPLMGRGTKGFETRQQHLNNFKASNHKFILLLDADMIYDPYTLERLRSHKLPYVSGLYTRRAFRPIAPIWFKPWAGHFPFEVWLDPPIEDDKLYKIGASGWGCILIHRDVILAVEKLLKGEKEIIEDDMDIWPYDLSTIIKAMRGLREIEQSRPPESAVYPALDHHLRILEQEIRPLKIEKENVGSDIRFPFYALHAGYQLIGDSKVKCKHITDYPLGYEDYMMFSDADRKKGADDVAKIIRRKRAEAKKMQEALYA